MRRDPNEPINVQRAEQRRDPLPQQYAERILRLAERLYNDGRGVVIIQKSHGSGGRQLHISSYGEDH